MKTKDLKINFRYLGGNISCLSVDSIVGKSIHNDINNEEAIIIFNSLVGEKENCQTVKKLLQENQELKSQLRGTTHCFDEEEHNRLKEEITNLSKDVDMWNSKYNDMFDENRELKEILANHGIVSTCENCETFGVCPHSYREYDYKYECDELKRQLENKEEKNLKLIGEIENLSKEIDMWMRKYNEVFDENRMLKKQVEERPKEYVFIGKGDDALSEPIITQ